MLARVRACSLSPFFPLWLVKRVSAGMLYAFKDAHTLFTSQREREREMYNMSRIVIFIFKRSDGCLGTF
jgi:hypothetical protein